MTFQRSTGQTVRFLTAGMPQRQHAERDCCPSQVTLMGSAALGEEWLYVPLVRFPLVITVRRKGDATVAAPTCGENPEYVCFDFASDEVRGAVVDCIAGDGTFAPSSAPTPSPSPSPTPSPTPATTDGLAFLAINATADVLTPSAFDQLDSQLVQYLAKYSPVPPTITLSILAGCIASPSGILQVMISGEAVDGQLLADRLSADVRSGNKAISSANIGYAHSAAYVSG